MCVNTVNGWESFSRVKAFAVSSYFDCLRHSDPKIFCLLDQSRGGQRIRFRRVDQIKAKNVFLVTSARMKAIAVIRRVHNKSAILKNDPFPVSVACFEIDRRGQKNEDDNNRDLAAQMC